MWRGETSDRGGKSYRSDVPFGEYLGGFVSRLCFSFSTKVLRLFNSFPSLFFDTSQ